MQVCMYATHGIVIPSIGSKAQCVILNGDELFISC